MISEMSPGTENRELCKKLMSHIHELYIYLIILMNALPEVSKKIRDVEYHCNKALIVRNDGWKETYSKFREEFAFPREEFITSLLIFLLPHSTSTKRVSKQKYICSTFLSFPVYKCIKIYENLILFL
jgi:hypothetical protein